MNLALTNTPFLSMNPVLMSDGYYMEGSDGYMTEIYERTIDLADQIASKKFSDSELPERLAEFEEYCRWLSEDEKDALYERLSEIVGNVKEKHEQKLSENFMSPQEVKQFGDSHGLNLDEAYDTLIEQGKVEGF